MNSRKPGTQSMSPSTKNEGVLDTQNDAIFEAGEVHLTKEPIIFGTLW